MNIESLLAEMCIAFVMLNYHGKNMIENNDEIIITTLQECALDLVDRMTPIFIQMANKIEKSIIEEFKKQ
jgi:hypothetical protein